MAKLASMAAGLLLGMAAIIPPSQASPESDSVETSLQILRDFAFASDCGVFTRQQAEAASLPTYHSLEVLLVSQGMSLPDARAWLADDIHAGQRMATTPGLCRFWSNHPERLARLDRLLVDAMNGRG